jgi:hypothetical protein
MAHDFPLDFAAVARSPTNARDIQRKLRSSWTMASATALSDDRPANLISSKLSDARERFLAQVVEHSLEFGRRSAADFVRHFSPMVIMSALREQPKLRAKILVPTTGVNERVALKKSAGSSGEDLEIALDEGVANQQQIVELFEADDRVRYLDHEQLWAFLTEGEFWNVTRADADKFAVAKSHIEFMVECARENGLLTDRDIVDGCTLNTIVERLPKHELCMLFEAALLDGRAGKPFKDEEVLSLAPPSLVLEHVPLKHVWAKVIVPKIAEALGFEQATEVADEPTTDTAGAAEDAAPAGSDPGKLELPKGSFAPRELPKPPSAALSAKPPKKRSKRLGSLDLSDLDDDAAAELDKLIDPT